MERSILICIFICVLVKAQCPSYSPDTRTVSGTVYDVWPCAAIDNSNYASCGSQLNAGQPSPICVTDPASWQCAQDFESRSGDDLLIPQNQLDPVNRVPVFNSATGPHQTVQDPAQFAYWYLPLSTFNIPIPTDLTVSNADTCDSLVYGYSNDNFFPIDGLGFGDMWPATNGHNFNFAYASHMRFTYQGYEAFNFEGDDDLFVFINGLFALDLGGLHTAEAGALDLTYPSAGCSGYSFDSNNPPLPCANKNGPLNSIPCACLLGVTPGQSYNFDLFYNERHTVQSDLKFTTSLFLQCPWYDHCGVCQGDGQTCCTCQPTNACYTAKCDVLTANCIQTETSCPPAATMCVTSYCDGTTGNCATGTVVCNDNNACTSDSCIDATGCSYQTISCDDNDPCTIDSCDTTAGCQHSTVQNCNPGCYVGGQPKSCPGTTACVKWECSYVTGDCANTTTVCDDNNACTSDTCDPTNGCEFPAISCDDGNPCTIDTCNTTTGCVNTPVFCDDLNACTNDTCNMTTGNCTFTPIEVPTGDFCVGIYCDPTVGIVKNPTQCPSACEGTCDPTSGCQKCPGSRWTPAVKAAVGIGAGAIAGIAVGGAAAVALGVFGGKKGYDAYIRNRNNLSGAQSNPMYNDSGRTGVNPFHA